MGCTGSRHALRGGVRSPHAWGRSRSGRAHHTVALKSSTLGSLSLERDEEMMKWRDDGGAGAAKTPPPKPQLMWRQKQVPGSPAREPEVINVWELMDGLDDRDEEGDDANAGGEKPAPGSPAFDPDVVAAFRKALDEIPPPPAPDGPGNDEERIKKPDGPGAGGGGDEVCVRKREIQRFPGIVRARVSAFQQRIDAKLAKLAPPPPAVPPPPDSARKVVVYLTSLRGVRKTYEDCWSTRSVLQSYGVRVDERDLSMHAGFKDELHAALGGSSAGRLPQVFADGRHLGGAEEIRRMHEAGELSEALEACEMAPSPSCPGGKGVALEACSGCGGVRFVPCEECSGSCKVFVEEAGTFRRCPECNENGLVRCPLCSL
jgi:glutaredoxin domain-containing cysteine-rich protein 1